MTKRSSQAHKRDSRVDQAAFPENAFCQDIDPALVDLISARHDLDPVSLRSAMEDARDAYVETRAALSVRERGHEHREKLRPIAKLVDDALAAYVNLNKCSKAAIDLFGTGEVEERLIWVAEYFADFNEHYSNFSGRPTAEDGRSLVALRDFVGVLSDYWRREKGEGPGVDIKERFSIPDNPNAFHRI